MDISKLIEWHNKDSENRIFTIRFQGDKGVYSAFKKSIWLYDMNKKNKNEENSVIFPVELLEEIKDFNDFVTISKEVENFQNNFGKHDIPGCLRRTLELNTKANFLSIGMFMRDIMGFVKNQPFEEFGMNQLENLDNFLRENISIEKVNANDLETNDLFKEKFDELKNTIIDHLVEKYEYRPL